MGHKHRRCASVLGALLLLGQCCTSALLATEMDLGPAETQPVVQTAVSSSTTASQPATESAPASSQPSTTQASANHEESVATITPEEIQARMASIEASTELPEPMRAQILEIYRQVLEQIASAQTWSSKISEYQQGQSNAPADLEAVQRELDAVTNAPAVKLELAESTTLEDLAQKIATADSELRQKQAAADKLAAQAQNRAERAQAIPALRTAAQEQLETLSAELAGAAEAGVPPQLALAQRSLLLARRSAIEQEIRAYQEELAFYQARSEVLATRRSKARLEVSQAQALLDELQAKATELRAAEVQKQKQRAAEGLKDAPWEIQRQLEINPRLAAQRENVSAGLAEVQAKLEKARVDEERISARLGRLRQRVEQDSDRDLLGPLMRGARLDLYRLRDAERESLETRKKYAQVQSRLSEVRERLLVLTDVDAAKRVMLAKLREDDPNIDLAPLEPKIREMLETRRELLEGLRTDYESYSTELLQLVDVQTRIVNSVRATREVVDRYSLWLPSTAPIFKAEWPDDREGATRRLGALRRLLLPEQPEQRLRGLIVSGLALVVLLAWLSVRPLLAAKVRDTGLRVAKIHTDSFRHTLVALLCSILRAACWPSALWFAAWTVRAAAEARDVAAYEMAQTLGAGLISAGMVIFFTSLVREICRPGGLGEYHFRWNAAGLRVARRSALSLMALAAPALFVIAAMEVYPDAEVRDLIGRSAFLLLMAAVIRFLWRIGHPERGIFVDWLRHHSPWLYRSRYVLLVALLMLPLLSAVAAAVGYYYTAQEMAHRLGQTARLALIVLLIHALLRRAFFVAQRRLAHERARRKRAAAAARLAEQGAAHEEAPAVEDEELDLISIGAQTRKLLRAVVIFIMAIGLWLCWSELLPALSVVGETKLWSYTGTEAAGQSAEGVAAVGGAAARVIKYVTLGDVTTAALVALATLVLARNIPGLLEIAILQRLPLDTGGRFAVTAVARYLIIVAGVVIAFGEIGVGWSRVQWLVAAMTVGLGFGLQEIFANFVSGLMLLFERPIRIGDTVTIGEISGVVSRIRIRATTITDWDRKELVIPNKEFITGKVINWTLSDSTLRIIIPVGIAYQSDTELAEQLLYKVARAHENVLSDPPPRVYFMGFGDSALQFELRVFVASVDLSMSTRHDLNKAIDHEFRQAGITIALPQRDIHVRTIQQPLALLHPEHHDHGKSRGGLSLGEAAPEQQRNLDDILRTTTPKSRDDSR